jgi:hypothetical protein
VLAGMRGFADQPDGGELAGYSSGVSPADVKDEIYDMVKPRDPLCITLEDLVECRVGHTVVTMLIDVNGFFEYDNREALMQAEGGQDVLMQPAADGAAPLEGGQRPLTQEPSSFELEAFEEFADFAPAPAPSAAPAEEVGGGEF